MSKITWKLTQLQQIANGERRIRQAGINAKYEFCSIAKRCMTIYSNRWLTITRKTNATILGIPVVEKDWMPKDSYAIIDGDGNWKIYNSNSIV